MKKYLFPAIILISGCCFSFLMVQPNKTGLIILAIGVLCSAVFAAYCYKTSGQHDFSLKKRSNLLSLLSAAVIVGFVGCFDGGLPKKYGDSGLVNSVFEKIGIDKTLGLTVLAVGICLVALPGVYAFFVFLQGTSEKEDNSAVGRFFSSNAFFYSCFAIGLLLCGCLIVTSFSYDVNVDDAFSLQLIKRSFARLTVLTANDFHPPLYYYLLKIFVTVFSFTGINEIFLGKLFSVIPYLILLLFCFVRFKKTKKNGFAIGISILLFACFLCTFFQAMLVRMYTWGLLFVTFAFLEAKWLIEEGDKKSRWILLTVFALFCCYTQYFAAIAAVMIYGMTGLYFLIKQRKLLWKLLVSGIAVAVGYSPWIFVLYRQIFAVTSDEKAISVINNAASDYVEYFITSGYDYHRRLFAELFFLMLLLLFLAGLIKRCRSNTVIKSWGMITGALLVVLVALFGDIVSLIGNPILLPRYLFMSLSALIISTGIVFQDAGKRLKTLFIGLICIMIGAHVAFFCVGQYQNAVKAKDWREMLLSEKETTMYVEAIPFGGRIIKQLTGAEVELFVDNSFSMDYESVKEKYKQSSIDIIDMVVYGDQFVRYESQNGNFLLNAVDANDSIVAILYHPEIAAQLEQTGKVKAEYIGECVQESQIFRLTKTE